MKDRLDILNAYRELARNETSAVLATVVKVQGSTYRRPGARMLISEKGETVGLISGGCLDTDLLERARNVIGSNTPVTVTFDTTSPTDLVFGLGLGCTGVAHVLLEPLQPIRANMTLDFISDCTRKQVPGILVSIFRVEGEAKAPLGSHLMLYAHGRIEEDIKNPTLVNALLEDARSALAEEKTFVKKYQLTEGHVEALIEAITPPIPLLIFGAGPDALPLARLAKQLGWHTTILDKRPAFADPKRFPEADKVLHARAEDISSRIHLDSRSITIIMTHNYESDLALLKLLLPSPVRYIGLLGPTKKRDLLLQKLREEGFEPTNEQLARLYNPVGLDVGAETPEEIALAIAAEIQSFLTGHSGGFLRDRLGPIH